MKRVIIFSHYDKYNNIEGFVINFLYELSKFADIIFVSDSEIKEVELKKIQPYIFHSIIGRHGEYDFGSYKRGFQYALKNNLLKNYNELFFINDSCYAPLFPFSKMLQKMENTGCDFWGITSNSNTYFSKERHIQSYFIAFKEIVFLSPIFIDFINSICKETNKHLIVSKYECGLTKHLSDNGFSWEVYSKYSQKHYACHILAYEKLIKTERVPFVKRSIPLLRANVFVNKDKFIKFIENNTQYNSIFIKEDIQNNSDKLSFVKYILIWQKTFIRFILCVLIKLNNIKRNILEKLMESPVNKIAVIAHYPVGDELKDGMYLRIKSVDSFFQNEKRCYIESSVHSIDELAYFIIRDIKNKRLFKSTYSDDKVSSIRYISAYKLNKIFKNANIIYIQTWAGLRVIPQQLLRKYSDKIYFDIHGCFVEEIEYLGQSKYKLEKAKKYEKQAFSILKNFVCVSQKMIELYKNKYPNTENLNYIKLPIFSLNKSSTVEKQAHDKIKIIYPGRASKWQNIPEMMSTISKLIDNPNYEFEIFTPDTDIFINEAQKYKIENLSIKNKKPNELQEEYKYADLGLILREDNIVNRVACPTKLIEYMENGVIPVVLQPEIGDFNALGYKYILNSDLISGNIPSKEEMEQMRIRNYQIIVDYNSQVRETKEKLQQTFEQNL